jgi:Uma2 family endonuclease
VLTGDAGAALDAENVVGIDVAYFSPAVMAEQDADPSKIVVGAPDLAVEILSPSDTNRKRNAKLAKFRRAGVKLVWVLDPGFINTITAYRLDGTIATYSGHHDVTAEDILPGFRVPAADLFG